MNDEQQELQRQLVQMSNKSWLSDGVLTWTWWFELGMVIIPWYIFLKLVDRKRSLSIWFFGLLVLIITAFTDDLGAEVALWTYPIKFIPISLISMPFDFSVVPVAQMLIYQYFQTWRTFLVALIVQALLFAYIGEPFSIWTKAIQYNGWKYSYSFIFYIFIGIVARAFVNYWEKKCADAPHT